MPFGCPRSDVDPVRDRSRQRECRNARRGRTAEPCSLGHSAGEASSHAVSHDAGASAVTPRADTACHDRARLQSPSSPIQETRIGQKLIGLKALPLLQSDGQVG